MYRTKELAGRQHFWEHGAAPLLSAFLKLNRVREAAARVSLWANQGRASTSVDIGGSKNRCFRIVQQAEDLGTFEPGRKAPRLECFFQAYVINAVEVLLELMVDRVKGQGKDVLGRVAGSCRCHGFRAMERAPGRMWNAGGLAVVERGWCGRNG
ncbi:hypothetical protein NDU88_005767 [Pleurodeles waltl]|uniref:Uncharacterized protein n=1 Tax=Pleurodeles waltl TaxID=8319 RepID=A0AAV7TWA4_PLEWA|nr:hypothetical protein NDU88_005767 [Pleurodeles waltl]